MNRRSLTSTHLICALAILVGQSAFSADDTTAFTLEGKEVALKKNGTWFYSKESKESGTKVKVGVKEITQSGTFCTIKYEVQNPTPANFKDFWPNTHLVDKKGYRFGSANIQIAIRPNQNSIAEVNYNDLKCDEVAKVEIGSFFSCTIYDGGKQKAMSDCEEITQPLAGTKIPIVIISAK